MVLLISLILLALSTFSGVKTGDYFAIDGHLYYSSYPDNATWYRAMRFCTFNRMYLADVPTQIENERIIAIINTTVQKYNIAKPFIKFWTSGSKEGLNEQYYWATSGNPLIWSSWGRGQPGDKKDAYCILYVSSVELRWNSWWCEINSYFICRDQPSTPINYRQVKRKGAKSFAN